MSFIDQLLEAEDSLCLDLVLQHYHQSLLENENAIEFLTSKGLFNPDVLASYKIGFCDRTLGTLIPKTHYKSGRVIRERFKKLGITKDNGIELHRGGLVIPLISAEGNVEGIYSYKVSNRLRPDTPREVYPESGVFNAQSLAEYKEVIVTESILDALTFIVNGYFNVVCIVGDDDTRSRYFGYLKNLEVERLISSENFFNRNAQLLGNSFDLYKMSIPDGFTINELCCSVPNAPEVLAQLIRTAEWVGGNDVSEGLDDLDEILSGDMEEDDEISDEDYEEVEEDLEDDFENDSLDILDLENTSNTNNVDPEILNSISEEFSEKKESSDSEVVDALEELDAGESLEKLPATRSPLPPLDQTVKEESHQIVVEFSQRQYRVRGLYSNTAHHRLKVSIYACYQDRLHIDELNLYQARSRVVFINQAKAELGLSEDTVKSDLGRLIFILEELLHKRLEQATTPITKPVTLPACLSQEAMEFLKSPQLLDKLLEDFKQLDVIGEDENLLVCYLAVTSRYLDDPMAVTIQSASASGKTSLMNGVLQLIPEAHKVSFSSITSQSLYYMDETGLQNKVLAIAELDGINKGSSAYSLKLLQSEKEISIATTLKDEKGNLRTQEKKVLGPVQFFCTTTRIDVDDELLNRTLVVSISDDKNVTEAIHNIQRKNQSLEALENKQKRRAIINKHHACQQLLKPVLIINPFAEQLTFATNKTRTRRDHQKYLNIIKAITFLHQYQRPIKTTQVGDKEVEYIETTWSDIQLANQIAHKVLGNCLLEDLPPQTQQLLFKITQMVQERCFNEDIPQTHCRFTRSDIREYSGWSISQLKVHCKRLEELEYLVKHQGGRGKIIDYELLWKGEGQDGGTFSLGLIDVSEYVA